MLAETLACSHIEFGVNHFSKHPKISEIRNTFAKLPDDRVGLRHVLISHVTGKQNER